MQIVEVRVLPGEYAENERAKMMAFFLLLPYTEDVSQPQKPKPSHPKPRRGRRVICAGGVVLRRDRRGAFILLTRHAKLPKWQLPKGHVEKGESLDRAALREIYEETGLRHARIVQKLAVVRRTRVNRKGEIKTIHYYLIKPLEPIRERPSDRAHYAVRWFPVDQAIKKLLLDEQKEMLRKYRTELG